MHGAGRAADAALGALAPVASRRGVAELTDAVERAKRAAREAQDLAEALASGRV
jgi:hypothetical protein